ncbi:DNA primase [Rhodobacteraceae bacterium 2CG4]|uniref:DNA primase n=1 Tax=Halovulum marinum TaxID=2662447 RepID=A0A6L5YXC4_9RHOB|nr:DNA primase [Halovulum marinum]MSU88600.1 DNA primase [Halovulum marinum]
MALPDGFLDELRNRVSIAQVAGRKVTWDTRKSNAAKGDMWAPCPFHGEKTASFHVDDAKGFYYCFGCHAKGDALSFVRETENVGFMDAVEILASEAGMTMPAPDPQAQKRAEQRAGLAEVMEMAVAWTRLQLSTAAAQAARDYLAQRGLTPETLKRFEIGFAPDSRGAMLGHLRDKGVPEADIVAAGLAIKPDDGGAAYDRFRGRIMFPIRDARGRAIAFGGRAMDPNARAKYLNSPETALFDKGRALYNIKAAREASGRSGALIVAEGYMDVIALAQAGLAHAVAPLGTAITDNQLQMLWRICPEPVIALDGDRAGIDAAIRLIDVALPLLEPGRALRFCVLPQGQDPDDLIKAEGAAAMQALLEKAVPMVDLLWRRETEGRSFDSPERRAALDARLRDSLKLIRDPILQSHYRDAIREKRAELFGPTGGRAPDRGFGNGRGYGGGYEDGYRGGNGGGFGGGSGRRNGRPFQGRNPMAPPLPSTRASILARRDADVTVSAARIRESAILLGCLNHPSLLAEIEPELDALRFLCPDLDALRRRILQVAEAALHADGITDDGSALRAEVIRLHGSDPADILMAVGQVRDNPHLRPAATPESALLVIREEMTKHRAAQGAEAERLEAETEITGVADEGLTWRLQQAAAAREASMRSRASDPRGGEEDTAALSNALQDMIEREIWRKRRE